MGRLGDSTPPRSRVGQVLRFDVSGFDVSAIVMTMNLRRSVVLSAAALAAAALLPGCGSSSKPAYCKQVSGFRSSIKELEKVAISPTNISGISTAVQNVSASAKDLYAAVKTEFAPQISTAKTSLEALEKSAKEVVASPSSSTLTHAVTVIPTEVETLKKAAAEVEDVTKSKCE